MVRRAARDDEGSDYTDPDDVAVDIDDSDDDEPARRAKAPQPKSATRGKPKSKPKSSSKSSSKVKSRRVDTDSDEDEESDEEEARPVKSQHKKNSGTVRKGSSSNSNSRAVEHGQGYNMSPSQGPVSAPVESYSPHPSPYPLQHMPSGHMAPGPPPHMHSGHMPPGTPPAHMPPGPPPTSPPGPGEQPMVLPAAMPGIKTAPLQPGSRVIEADPEYMRGFTALRKKAEAWSKALEEKRELPEYTGDETLFWAKWLTNSDTNSMMPRPNEDMRKFVAFQVQLLSKAAKNLPTEEELAEKEEEENSRKCTRNFLVFLVILLAAGCAVAAYFAYTGHSGVSCTDAQVASLTTQLAQAKAEVQTQADTLNGQLENAEKKIKELQTKADKLELLQTEVGRLTRELDIESREVDALTALVAELQSAAAAPTLLSQSLTSGGTGGEGFFGGDNWFYDSAPSPSPTVVRFRDGTTQLNFNEGTRNWRPAAMPAGFGYDGLETELDGVQNQYALFETRICLSEVALAKLADSGARLFLFVNRDESTVVQLNGESILSDVPRLSELALQDGIWNAVYEVSPDVLTSSPAGNTIHIVLENFQNVDRAWMNADLQLINASEELLRELNGQTSPCG